MNVDLVPRIIKWLDEKASYLGIRDLCSIVLDDERFPIWSGSSKSKQHHYGKHGLIIHTSEVIKLSLTNNTFYCGSNGQVPVDPRKLFLAGLFHDAGKMWDYEPVSVYDEAPLVGLVVPAYSEWRPTTHKRRIHHISRSALIWQEACSTYYDRSPVVGRPFKPRYDWLTQEFIDDVLHAILAHHGCREWGSPVSPNTKLAYFLHTCDMISARIEDCDNYDRIGNA
jgi:hypothetical protein